MFIDHPLQKSLLSSNGATRSRTRSEHFAPLELPSLACVAVAIDIRLLRSSGALVAATEPRRDYGAKLSFSAAC